MQNVRAPIFFGISQASKYPTTLKNSISRKLDFGSNFFIKSKKRHLRVTNWDLSSSFKRKWDELRFEGFLVLGVLRILP